MDSKLLEILGCPVCKGPLEYHHKAQELICRRDKLVFRVREGIPVMILEEAKPLVEES